VRAGSIALSMLALCGCGGETFEVGLCPSPALVDRGGGPLSRVQIIRIGFQEVDGDSVVAEEIVQGSADGFSADGVADSGSRLSIWMEGLEAADSTQPLVTGSTPGPTRVDGIRAVCICVTEPANWGTECEGVSCSFDGAHCSFP